MDVTYCSDLTEKPPEPCSPRPVYREGRPPGHEYLASFMYDLMVNHFVERVYLANLAAIGHLKVTRVQTSPYHAIAYLDMARQRDRCRPSTGVAICIVLVSSRSRVHSCAS
jgi:hypothetical protein